MTEYTVHWRYGEETGEEVYRTLSAAIDFVMEDIKESHLIDWAFSQYVQAAEDLRKYMDLKVNNMHYWITTENKSKGFTVETVMNLLKQCDPKSEVFIYNEATGDCLPVDYVEETAGALKYKFIVKIAGGEK